MNGRYERDDVEDMQEAPTPAAEREISLGTGAMLGIFFALVLVCGAFFGFGYSMGHKSTPPVTSAASTSDPETSAVSDSKAATTSPSDAPAVIVKPSAAGSGGRSSAPAVLAKSAPSVPDHDASPEDSPKAAAKPYITVPTTLPASTAPALPSAVTPTAGAGTVYVQISAVSHQEDAQLLMSALKRRGYEATVRKSPQDQLLHVQLGPYASKKDADAMKQRLSADGYNAILK